MIGNYYQYPNCKKKFKLTGINEMKNVYYFECGHRCTDNVFHDLIDCQAKIQNYKKIQLDLFS